MSTCRIVQPVSSAGGPSGAPGRSSCCLRLIEASVPRRAPAPALRHRSCPGWSATACAGPSGPPGLRASRSSCSLLGGVPFFTSPPVGARRRRATAGTRWRARAPGAGPCRRPPPVVPPAWMSGLTGRLTGQPGQDRSARPAVRRALDGLGPCRLPTTGGPRRSARGRRPGPRSPTWRTARTAPTPRWPAATARAARCAAPDPRTTSSQEWKTVAA